MIIWIASYPRSGNNLTRRTLESLYGINTYAIYNEPRQPKIDVEAARNSDEIFLVKTHDLPEDDSPALYLVRDGRDALVSFARFTYVERMVNKNLKTNLLVYPAYARQYFSMRKSQAPENYKTFRAFSTRYKRRHVEAAKPEALWPILRELMLDTKAFGGWGANVLAWTQRQAPTQVLKFEDIIQHSDTAAVLRNPLETLGYTFGPVVGKAPKFKQLKKTRPDLYQKGQTGSHKDEMPAELETLFWEKYGHVMEQLGYSR